METEKLEKEVITRGGEHGKEIVELLKELAKVDIEIKNALDEIEAIKAGLPERHNELADKINELVKLVASEPEETPEEEPKKEPPAKSVKVEVHIMRHRFSPCDMAALMNWLFS